VQVAGLAPGQGEELQGALQHLQVLTDSNSYD
jgi:hypothetical protein